MSKTRTVGKLDMPNAKYRIVVEFYKKHKPFVVYQEWSDCGYFHQRKLYTCESMNLAVACVLDHDRMMALV